MTNTNLQQFQTELGHQFKDLSLLEKALTHRSFLNESSSSESNERLEYLGDAVLELIVSEYLFQKLASDPEGILTAARAAIVRTESLAKVSLNLQVGEYLKLSHGEEKTGGRTNTSLLANTFEAILGAIYLDTGFTDAKKFVHQHLIPLSESVLTNNLKDPKSLFQEKVQTLGYTSPVYETLSEAGPDHDKHFVVAVVVGGKRIATGSGKSKQTAQQDAAERGLENLPPQVVK